MKVEQIRWEKEIGWINPNVPSLKDKANLVIVFGGRDSITSNPIYSDVRKYYPNAVILINSTAGEIADIRVYDETVIATAIYFEKTQIKAFSINITDYDDSQSAGEKIGQLFPLEKLKHIFIVSDGHKVNGSKLVEGLNSVFNPPIPITGGLAGDGVNFRLTSVGLNHEPSEGIIAAIGFYGDSIKIGYGSRGGWDSFGPSRLITRSKDNILYEMDGQSALTLYKKYLGPKAAELPGSALLFPLSIQLKDSENEVVRTVLAVNEEEQSMIFAGDMPMGSRARLMKANFDRVIDGANLAAIDSIKNESYPPDLAILISCVGRKIVLGQRIEEEIENVRDFFGSKTTITGFYSYGEIAPLMLPQRCELHNQTMTITTFTEI